MRALADLEQGERRPGDGVAVDVPVALDDRLLAEALVVEAQRDCDGAIAAHGVGDGSDELRVEPVDGNRDAPAAAQADVEAVLVVEAVEEQASA